MFRKNIFRIFRKPAPLRTRLHTAAGAADIVLSLSIFFLCLFSDAPLWAAAGSACLLAGSVAVFFVPALSGNRNAAEISVFAYTNMLLPAAFLLSGGTDGSMPLYFVSALSVSSFLLSGWKRRVFIPLFLSGMSSSCFSLSCFPDTSSPPGPAFSALPAQYAA